MQHHFRSHHFGTFALAIALAGLGNFAWAADTPDKEKTPAQNRMAQCNQEAKGKTGEERKDFMKSCLSQKKSSMDKPAGSQQSKMKTCNDQARGKKGDERKAFMSECLKA
jgi:hypothetical protein